MPFPLAARWVVLATMVGAVLVNRPGLAEPPAIESLTLTFEQALGLALEQSPELLPNNATARRARAALGHTGGAAVASPRLEVFGGSRHSPDQRPQPELGVGLSQTLSLSGLGDRREAHGRAALRLAEAELDERRLTVGREVAQAWVELRATQRRQRLQGDRVRRARLLSRTVAGRAAVGAVSRAESALAEAALARAENMFAQAREDNVAAQHRLRLLLDLPPGATLSTSGQPPKRARPADSNRVHPLVEVAAAGAAYLDADADLLLAEGGASMDLGATAMREGTGDWVFLGSLRIPLPLFNANEHHAAQRRVPAEGMRREAAHWVERRQRQLEYLELRAQRHEGLIENIRNHELGAARQALGVVEAEHAAGKATVPLLLSTEESVADAEAHLLDAETELLRIRVEQAFTEGTLLEWARRTK